MENSEECRILSDTLEKHYENILKTALAVSIIRGKPRHMSGKVYAQVLHAKITGNEKHWKLKARALEDELLSVKEELIKAKFLFSTSGTEKVNASSNNIDDQDTDMESMECLTPPCSSESTRSDELQKNIGSDHAKFLKSIVSVWNAPKAADMLKDTQLCLHLFTTVCQAVTVLRDRIQHTCFAETSIPECCVDCLIGLLDMEIPDSQRTVETVFDFASEMIQAIMNHEICSSNTILEKYSKLIIRLALHKKIAKLILAELAKQLATFSETLRAISQDPTMLQGSLEKYSSIYYILWCIENILSKKQEDNSLQSLSKSLMATLEDSVLHLSKTFPLFTCYVWRIGGLISPHCAEESMDIEHMLLPS